MKTIKLLSVLALAATLLSFTLGGEHYQISVNGTKALEYFVYQKKEVPTLSLDKNAANISVFYNNCGHASKGRALAVVDDKNKILKQWKFDDVANLSQSTMNVDGKEITSLMSKSNTRLSLTYTSNDLTQGRVLAILQMGEETVAKTE
jgi:hypothetical protein